MKEKTFTGFLFCILISFFSTAFSSAAWEGDSKDWKGYQRFDFEIEGRPCFVVIPKKIAPGKPWVWRARFPSFHGAADLLLLERGFHIAHIDTNGMLGSPRALKHWDAFYAMMTDQQGLARKPALEAVVSLNDRVVPPDENTFVLARKYRELGGEIEIIEVKEGTEKSNGHHFTHPDPKRAADFIERHASPSKAP